MAVRPPGYLQRYGRAFAATECRMLGIGGGAFEEVGCVPRCGPGIPQGMAFATAGLKS